MSSTWDESGRVMRNLGDIIDAVSRVIVVAAEIARDHADCEPLLDALDKARGHLASAEIELHNHARAFEEASRTAVEDDERDRE